MKYICGHDLHGNPVPDSDKLPHEMMPTATGLCSKCEMDQLEFKLRFIMSVDEAARINVGEFFYIQDTRSYSGNSCFWWCVDAKGYTCDLKQAWRVSKDEAQRIIRNRETDIAWPCSLIDAGAAIHFDMQKLRGENPLQRAKKGSKIDD